MRNGTTGNFIPGYTNASIFYLLGILEEQARYNSNNEKFNANVTSCVQWFLTDYQSEKIVESSLKLGVALLPGSKLVLDRETEKLKECTNILCPRATWYDDIGFVNHISFHPQSFIGTFTDYAFHDLNRLKLVNEFWHALSSPRLAGPWWKSIAAPKKSGLSNRVKGPFRSSQIDVNSQNIKYMTNKTAVLNINLKINNILEQTTDKSLIEEVDNILRVQYTGEKRNSISPLNVLQDSKEFRKMVTKCISDYLIKTSQTSKEKFGILINNINYRQYSTTKIHSLQEMMIRNPTFIKFYGMSLNSD